MFLGGYKTTDTKKAPAINRGFFVTYQRICLIAGLTGSFRLRFIHFQAAPIKA